MPIICLTGRMAFRHTAYMKRTTIWLTDSQVKALAKVSNDTGMKQAEIVRRCIDAGLQGKRLDWRGRKRRS